MTELSTVRGLFYDLLDAKLNTDAGAAVLSAWSDKMRKQPLREWQHLPPATQELYRLLTYQVLLAVVADDDPYGMAYYLADDIARSEEVVP